MSATISNIPIKLATCEVDSKPYTATAPKRGTAGAAGYDLCAYLPTGQFMVQTMTAAPNDETFAHWVAPNMEPTVSMSDTIPPGHRALIPTGVSMAIPEGWYGHVSPRSGLSWKQGMGVMAGVIDSDYRGDIGVVLINMSDMPFRPQHGDRIAQIIFKIAAQPAMQVVSDLQESARGAAGYGSTGRAGPSVDLTEPVRSPGTPRTPSNVLVTVPEHHVEPELLRTLISNYHSHVAGSFKQLIEFCNQQYRETVDTKFQDVPIGTWFKHNQALAIMLERVQQAAEQQYDELMRCLEAPRPAAH